MPKVQRIRDPVHNLIEFNATDLEQTIWRVIQTPPFQRLRRIKQLGFSEFVFPGATHSRFAHSIGVFHTARRLIEIICKTHGTGTGADHRANVAMAAALVHDVGHGMFSHAFEAVAKSLGHAKARHELVSVALIEDSEISEVFGKYLGSGFANDVAKLIGRKEPQDIFDSVVSSQFDADRLDYMQRDRLMTGVQSSGIDLTWLLANLEVASVPRGPDGAGAGNLEVFVLGSKATNTAESYVLSLFHLYPNIYLHKATRAAEVVFRLLFERAVQLVLKDEVSKTGLPENHAIVRFARERDSISCLQALDDTVFWGALGWFCEASDEAVQFYAAALRDRKLPECIDLRLKVERQFPLRIEQERSKNKSAVDLACRNAKAALMESEFAKQQPKPRLIVDFGSRTPYRNSDQSGMPFNQIMVAVDPQNPVDVGAFSPIVAGASKYEVLRAYVWRGDAEARDFANRTVDAAIEETKKTAGE